MNIHDLLSAAGGVILATMAIGTFRLVATISDLVRRVERIEKRLWPVETEEG